MCGHGEALFVSLLWVSPARLLPSAVNKDSGGHFRAMENPIFHLHFHPLVLESVDGVCLNSLFLWSLPHGHFLLPSRLLHLPVCSLLQEETSVIPINWLVVSVLWTPEFPVCCRGCNQSPFFFVLRGSAIPDLTNGSFSLASLTCDTSRLPLYFPAFSPLKVFQTHLVLFLPELQNRAFL